MSKWKDRIVSLERVRVGDIASHPGNWRNHDQYQVDVMRGVLAEVGMADALLVYRSERNGGKLTTIDGHLRKDIDPDAVWPVLVLDATDAEADFILATLDPTAALAAVDAAALDALLDAIHPQSDAVLRMLSEMAAEAGLYVPVTNPDVNYDRQVTADDVARVQGQLNDQFANVLPEQFEMFCPSCGKSFFVNR